MFKDTLSGVCQRPLCSVFCVQLTAIFFFHQSIQFLALSQGVKEPEVCHEVHAARTASFFYIALGQEKARQLSWKKNSDWYRMEVIPESGSDPLEFPAVRTDGITHCLSWSGVNVSAVSQEN